MDEEERQDKREDAKATNKLRDGIKKEAKSKFKMMLRKWIIALLTTKVGLIFICVLGVIAVLAVATHILDIRGSTDITDVATETVITENTEIKPAPNPADGYYFQISDDVVNQFLVELNRAYYEGHYLDHIAEDGDDKKYEDENNVVNGISSGISDENAVNQSNYVYDPDDTYVDEKDIQEWFNSKEYEDYLIKFIRAEIASMYPKLGNYGTGNTGEKDNPKDSERKIYSTGCSTNSKNTYESRWNYRSSNNTYI